MPCPTSQPNPASLPPLPPPDPHPTFPPPGGTDPSRRQQRSDEGSGDGRRSSKSGGTEPRQGLRGLFFNILRSRFDSGGGSGGGGMGGDGFGGSGEGGSPKSIESQLVRREGSMHLPRPADCNMPGTHSGERGGYGVVSLSIFWGTRGRLRGGRQVRGGVYGEWESGSRIF